jgi:hypothetical protein
MLGRLFKHEMRACSRLLLPLYLVLVVLTLLDRIVINLHIFNGVSAIIPGLITFAYVMSLLAIVIVSFVIIVMRFYKNLITDEGYLMFTLPVKPRELINSKLIAAMLWTLLSVIAVLASIFAVVITPARLRILSDGLSDGMQKMHTYFGAFTALFIAELILIFLIATIQSILHIYSSVAIGQLVNGHKVLGSFAAYIVIYVVCQIIGVVATVVGGFIFRFNNSAPDSSTVVFAFMPLMFVYILVFSIGFYWVTDFLFKRKLNLE